LGEGEPLGLVLGGVRKVGLGSEHGGHSPEGLVIVAQRRCPVWRHVAVCGSAGLVDQGPLRYLVVLVVPCVVPVVDDCAEHGAGLPPVVGTNRRRPWQDADCLAGLVARVVVHEVACDDFGGGFDRSCERRALVSCSLQVMALTTYTSRPD